MKLPNITAIVLTKNESQHLARCLASLDGVVSSILVVDSFSTDDTVDIALKFGATTLSHEWVNYATQFNWAVNQLDGDTEWVLRIDADEYVTRELATQIIKLAGHDLSGINGLVVRRRMRFQGVDIRHGGLFPISVLRIFRFGAGECENRWMDEHIKVTGQVIKLSGEIVDDNLNTLTWWTDKHNRYASREAVDILNLKYQFMPHDSVADLRRGGQAGYKRWLKENVYSHIPPGFRAMLYFVYRYIFRGGFLDGRIGGGFHILQGFWYRYLVDLKVLEVERYCEKKNVDIKVAIDAVLGIQIDGDHQ